MSKITFFLLMMVILSSCQKNVVLCERRKEDQSTLFYLYASGDALFKMVEEDRYLLDVRIEDHFLKEMDSREKENLYYHREGNEIIIRKEKDIHDSYSLSKTMQKMAQDLYYCRKMS